MPSRSTSAKRKAATAPAPVAEPIGPRSAIRVREETWPIERIKPYEGNARLHPQEQIDQLRESYRAFGQVQRVLVDEDGVLICGHGRHQALCQEKFAEVRVLVAVGWSDIEKRSYRLADNQIALNSTWDEKLLRGEALELSGLGVAIDRLGFGVVRAAQLLFVAPEGLTDPDEAPPLPILPTSERGDVWLLGRHRITCGDCTNPEDVARALGGARPHLMVTDPPYGVEYDPAWRVRAGHGSAGQAVGEVLNDDRADWREAWALFPGDVAYIWHAGSHCHEVGNSLEACRFKIRAHIIWAKTRQVFGRGDYHFQHEPCFYGAREGGADHWQHFVPDHEVATYTVRDGERGHYEGGRKQSTVWTIEHAKSDTGHGTQKPVEAMRRPIENNSRIGDAVYEPFSGSGTTIIAAEVTGRAARAVELNPLYVDVAVKRWQNFTGLAATLESNGRPFDDVVAERDAARLADQQLTA